MAAKPRSGRRRRQQARASADAADSKTGTLVLKGNEVAAAGLLTGFVLLFVGIALLASSGTGEGSATTSPGDATTSPGAATTSPSAATTSPGDATTSPDDVITSPDDVITSPSPGGETTVATPQAGSDEEVIQSLARRSIEVLPADQWPSLYDSFTSEFQQRCSREQFDQVGEDSAAQLGDDVRLLRFKRTEGVTIEGLTAQAVIVGEIVGQSEYQTQAAFQKENGVWKIAPVPGTEGCAAFGRLGG